MNQLSTVLSLTLLGIILVLPLLRPRLALVTWLVQFPLEQVLQGNIQWFLSNDLVVNALALAVVGVAAGRILLTEPGQHRHARNPACWVTLLLFAYAGTSVVWSQDQKLAIETIRLTLPYGAVAVLLLPVTLRDLADFSKFRWWFLVLGSLLAVAVLTCPAFRFYGTRALVLLGGNVRGNPLIVAEVGGLMFMIGALSRDSRGVGLGLLLRATAMILGLGMCLASGSRGQFLAAVAATFVTFPFARPVRNLGAVVSTVLGVPLILITLYYTMQLFIGQDNFNRWTGDSIVGGVQDRLLFVWRYLEAWAQSPLAWVVGFGTFSFPVLGGGLAGFVENFMVEILIEEGIPMFMAVSICIGFTVVSVARFGAMPSRRPADRISSTCLLGLITFYFLIGIKSYNVWTAYPFWLSLILALKLCRATEERDEDQSASDAAETEDFPPDSVGSSDEAPRPFVQPG